MSPLRSFVLPIYTSFLQPFTRGAVSPSRASESDSPSGRISHLTYARGWASSHYTKMSTTASQICSRAIPTPHGSASFSACIQDVSVILPHESATPPVSARQSLSELQLTRSSMVSRTVPRTNPYPTDLSLSLRSPLGQPLSPQNSPSTQSSAATPIRTPCTRKKVGTSSLSASRGSRARCSVWGLGRRGPSGCPRSTWASCRPVLARQRSCRSCSTPPNLERRRRRYRLRRTLGVRRLCHA
jgi:hypothetical protein